MSTIAVDFAQGEAAGDRPKRKAGSGSRNRDGKSAEDSPKELRQPFKKKKGLDKLDKVKPIGKKWNKPCLNSEECSGIHRIRDCPNTSDEKRKELLDKCYSDKKASMKSIKALPEDPREIQPHAEDGRWHIVLEDKVYAVVLGDSGSDQSAISATLAKSVCEAEPEVHLIPLQNPVTPGSGNQ